MSEQVLWSVLIATLASREEKFRSLMTRLLPQAEAAGCVEVVAFHNNGERPLGDVRHALLGAGRGAYLSFIDDDDDISPDFVSEIVRALELAPDCVGFKMKYYEGGFFIAYSHHSLRYTPHNEEGNFFRDISHQQPVKAALARKGDFRTRWPEDAAWHDVVRPYLEKEVFIDKVLYHYMHDWADSVQGQLRPHTYSPRPVISSPAFRWID